MGDGQPSNAVLLEKLENMSARFNSDMGDVKEHLRILNGSVAENTAARNQQKVINKILFAVGGGFLTIITALLIRFF